MAFNQNYGRLAFLYANHNANEKTIQELSKHGNINYQLPSNCHVDSNDLSGDTVLHITINHENLDNIKLLLSNKADISIKNSQGMTVLHQAIECERRSINGYIYKLRGPLKDSLIDLLLSAHFLNDLSVNPRSQHGLTHLHAACITNNVSAIEFFLKDENNLINDSINVDSPCFPGYTALHLAVRYCSAEVAKILLKNKARVDVKNREGLTPLDMLIKRNMEIADWKNMGKRSSWGQLRKEYNSNESLIEAILERNENEMFVDAREGLTNLHLACMLRDTWMLKRLLDDRRVIYLDKQTRSLGYTALHFAARFNLDSVKLLLKHGAKVSIKDVDNFTALDLCLQRYKTEEMSDLIMENWKDLRFSDGRTKLVDFIRSLKTLKEFESFVEKNFQDIDVHIPRDSLIFAGYTPLHLVSVLPGRNKCIDDLLIDTLYSTKIYQSEVFNCDEDDDEKLYIERIKVCLEKSPDLNAQDCNRSTALHLVFKLQHESIAKLIAEKYIDSQSCEKFNHVDDNGISHFHIACSTGVMKLVRYLLRKYRIQCSDYNRLKTNDYEKRHLVLTDSHYPLHIAVAKRNVELLEFLLNEDFNIYAEDEDGSTPIHRSIKAPEMFDLLFRWRMKNFKDRIDDCGLSHLHVACLLRHVKAVRILVKNGADVNAKVSIYCEDVKLRGLSPLSIALKERSRNIVKILILNGAKIFAQSRLFFDQLYELYPDLVFEALEIEDETTLTELHVACFTLDVKRVERLLKNGANPNARINKSHPIWSNFTPLHFLVMENKRRFAMVNTANEIVKMMIEKGADVNLTIDGGVTALHEAFTRICCLKDNDQRVSVSRACKSVVDGITIPKRLKDLLRMKPVDLDTRMMHGWNDNARSQNIHLKDPLTCQRGIIGPSSDSIRGKVGYTKGLHVWQIHWNRKERGSHAVVGIATSDAPLSCSTYTNLVGSCESSWGWDIKNNKLVYYDCEKDDKDDQRDVYPAYLKDENLSRLEFWTGRKFEVPDKITVVLDMDDGTLAFMIDDEYLGVAFEGFKGKTIYPTVSCVWGEAEITIEYIGGLEGEENSQSILDVLLNGHHDFNVNPTNNQGLSFFHIACLCDNTPIVEEFLKHAVNVNRPIDHFHDTFAGYTPLHLAARYKLKETVNLLLEYGADIHAKDRDDNTPLHCAADYSSSKVFNREDIEEVLLCIYRAGGDIKAKNRFDQTPIELLMETKGISSKSREMFLGDQRYVNIHNGFGAGYIATAISRELSVHDILKNPVYAAVFEHPEDNGPDDVGRTPIHNIVALGCKETFLNVDLYVRAIEGFEKLDFDIDQEDYEGRTPLHYAVKFRNAIAIRALLRLGADFNIIDIDGETPYSLGWKLIRDETSFYQDAKECPDIFKIFVEHVCKMNIVGLEVNELNEEVDRRVRDLFELKDENEIEYEKDFQRLENEFFGMIDLREFLSDDNAQSIYQNMDEQTRQSFDELFQADNEKLGKTSFVGLLRMQYRKVRAYTTLNSAIENTSFFSFLSSYLSWA